MGKRVHRSVLSRVAGVLFTLGAGAALIAPPAEAAVGRTEGHFNVGSTGSSSYSIPIFTPPGPRGTQPSIALAYSSDGGIGPVGKGWSIAGVASISRCGKTPAQDTSAAAVSLMTSDGYCFSGKRLRLTSGVYGLAGSTYQTEVADFSLVTAVGTAGNGPASFTVKANDGLLYEFGNTTDSRVIATGTSTATTWMLNLITDRDGNRVKFNYKLPDPGTTGTTEPTSIEWAATSPGASTFVYRMDFGYGNNTPASTPTGYVAGTLSTNDDLLTSVTVFNSSVVVKKYVLGYGPSPSPTTGASRLSSVKECSDAAESNCLPATTISYQDGATGISSTPVWTQSGTYTGLRARKDFNGDGVDDVLYKGGSTWYVAFGSVSGVPGSPINTGITTTTMANGYVPMLAADFGARGKASILANTSGVWREYVWNGSAFVGATTGLAIDTVPDKWLALDVTGDGKADLVSVTPAAVIKTYPNTGSASGAVFGAPVTYNGLSSSPYPYVIADLEANVESFDYDGDGRKDLFAVFANCFWSGPVCYPIGSTYLALRSSDGLQYSQWSVTTTNVFSMALKKYVADWNGDGCSDAFVHDQIIIARCAGAAPTTLNISNPVLGALDWNGDGRRDELVQYSGSLLGVRLSTGTGLGGVTATTVPYSSACTYYIVDIDGDALDDIACHQASGSTPGITYYRHNGAGVKPDLVTNVSDGYQFGPTWSYVPASWNNHTKQTNATYPIYDYQGPLYVVAAQTVPDGIGGTYSKTYWYYGGAMSANGRGFAGFAARKETDSRTGAYEIDYYIRDFPFTGGVTTQESYQSSGVLVSRRDTTLSQMTLDATANNQRYFTYASAASASNYEVGGAVNGQLITTVSQSMTYDSWGNQIASSSVVTDADTGSPHYGSTWTTQTATTYYPDTGSNWCLRLPVSSSVSYTTSVAGEPGVSRSSSYTPDYAHCRITGQIIEPGSSNRQVSVSYGFDVYGNVSSQTVVGRDPAGSNMAPRVSSTTWGSANGVAGGTGQFPVISTNALGQSTARTFSSTFGELATQTDPNGIVVASNVYDAFGRVQRTTRADGTSTVLTYANCAAYGCQNGDPASPLTSVDKLLLIASERDTSDAEFRATWSHLDMYDRLIVQNSQMASGGYDRVGRQYDAMGRVYRETAPCDQSSCAAAYWVTNTYDLLGRLTSQSRPQSQSVPTPVVTTISYAGRSQTVTDAQSKVSTKILDVIGRMRRSQDHDGYYQSFSYDAAGSLKKVVDSLSNELFVANYSYGIQAFRDFSRDNDLGEVTSYHNSLGELTAFTDAKSQSTGFSYDPLSRVTARTEAEGTTSWNWGTSAASHNIGQLESVSMTGGGYGESFVYDGAGRVATRNITTDQGYAIDYAYTNQGLLDTVTYPVSTASTRLKVKYDYTYGVLQSATDWTTGSAGTAYWVANARNVRGQTTQETLGNGVVTNRAFDGVTGWLNTIQSGVSGGTGLQNQSYLYDLVGNVTQRQENTLGLTENFYYDNLYRLSYSQRNGATNLSLSYDAMGNIASKAGVGSYDYTSAQAGCSYYAHAQRHAVRNAGGAAYCYDANGNMTKRNGQTIAWSSFNYPTALATASESAAFYYGPDRQYYKQVYSGPGVSETTHYVGEVLEKVDNGSATDWRHYIHADGQVVAIVSRRTSGNAVYYPLEDHEGSGSVLASSSGANLARQSYEAFGLPRDGSDWDGAVPAGDQVAINAVSRRGYTGHSMLGSMGLIHMNGRVQDALLGRFLSADPNVPDPGNTQSYGRYSYVLNNPLRFVDPTGFDDELPPVIVPGRFLYVPGGGVGGSPSSGHYYGGHNWTSDEQDRYNRDVGPEYARERERLDELEEVTIVATRPKWKFRLLENAQCHMHWGMNCAAVNAMTDSEALAARIAQEFSVPLMGIGGIVATGAARASVNPKIYAQLEKQLARDGAKTIIKALRSAEKALAQHRTKLQEILKDGGYPSQVQGTIRNVESQIETLKKFISDNGL